MSQFFFLQWDTVNAEESKEQDVLAEVVHDVHSTKGEVAPDVIETRILTSLDELDESAR